MENRKLTTPERVEVSALLLDVEHPGWAERIDRETFTIGNPRHCICGQLGGPKAFVEVFRFVGGSAIYARAFTYVDIRESEDVTDYAWLAEIERRLPV